EAFPAWTISQRSANSFRWASKVPSSEKRSTLALSPCPPHSTSLAGSLAIKKLPSTGDAPRSTNLPAGLIPGGKTDSAGYPWAGRSFDHHDTAFADDDGRTPPAYIDAVQYLRAAALEWGDDPTPATRSMLAEQHARALHSLSRIRVLVPLLAEAGELGETPEGRGVDKTQELSIVTVAPP